MSFSGSRARFDNDLGRHGGGPLRLRYAVEQLRKLAVQGLNPKESTNTWAAFDPTHLIKTRDWLASQHNVFYSTELDLDMMMLQAFPAAYGEVAGVDASAVPAGAYKTSVFGEKGAGVVAYSLVAPPNDLQQAQYAALFKDGSKPVSHVEALSRLDDDAIRAGAPASLQVLFARCRALLFPVAGTGGA